MVTVTDISHCRNLAYSLWTQATKGENTDVAIQYRNSSFSVHLCVMQSYPVFFERIGLQVDSEFTSIDADVFESIVKFLYTGTATFPEELIAEIKDFAEKYELDTLYQLCMAPGEANHEPAEISEMPVNDAVTVVVESQQTGDRISSNNRRTKSLKCLQCKKKFNEISELSKHYAEHAGQVAVNFCKTCGIKFTDDVTEEDHICCFKKGKRNANVLSCSYCAEYCGSEKILKKHESQHKCTRCNKVFDTVEYQRDHECEGTDREKLVFECTNCWKKYTSKQCFINHLKAHNGTNYFNCQFCPKTFLHHLPFKKHVISHTMGAREEYQCKVCGEKFKLKIKYYAHCIRLSHSLDEVPYSCKVCKRLFSNERDLISHCRVHYAEKPFKCSRCDKTYSSKLGLKLHVTSIHLKDFRYECDKCQKKFSQPSHLSEHKKIHLEEKDFVCTFCGLQLSSKASLRRHEGRHSHSLSSSQKQCT